MGFLSLFPPQRLRLLNDGNSSQLLPLSASFLCRLLYGFLRSFLKLAFLATFFAGAFLTAFLVAAFFVAVAAGAFLAAFLAATFFGGAFFITSVTVATARVKCRFDGSCYI
jgi:hypothetical protein